MSTSPTEEEIQAAYAASIIDQPLTPLDASFEDLPERIERRCCPGKSCGNTGLRLVRQPVLDDTSPTGASLLYGYVRESNDDVYLFGMQSTPAALAPMLNDRTFFPVDVDAYKAASRLRSA